MNKIENSDMDNNTSQRNLQKVVNLLPILLFLLLILTQIFTLWFTFQYFGASKYKAATLAKNNENIKNGCAYYVNNTKTLIIKIDDYSSEYQSFNIKNVPFDKKSKLFYEHLIENKDSNICYPVKYLKVNILFTHKYFLYDADIPKSF